MPRRNEGLEPTTGEVLAALSRALDLVEGQPAGHAVRTSMIAIRIADELGLTATDRANLFYAALIKDSGCSNNAARIHKIFGGDELLAKRNVKFVNWSSPIRATLFGVSHAERGGTLIKKLRKIAEMARTPTGVMDEVTQARCTRGAQIARMLGLGEDVAAAVQSLDEHWDGMGSPAKLVGDRTPLLARILGLAQTLEVFCTTFSTKAGYKMLKARSGKWFEPALVEAARAFEHDAAFWALHDADVHGQAVPLPVEASVLDRKATGIDQVCQAFAEIIDAKSTFTGEHSSRVTKYSVELGQYFGFAPARLTTLRRAALLHDIGKLGVPNSILDKPSKLDEAEFQRVRLHPKFSHDILEPIRGFERVTEIASAHHERIDGKGYWQGLSGDQIDLDMRIVSAADVFDALSAERPYRGAMPLDQVFGIMRKEAGSALDADCVEALAEIYQGIELMAA